MKSQRSSNYQLQASNKLKLLKRKSPGAKKRLRLHLLPILQRITLLLPHQLKSQLKIYKTRKRMKKQRKMTSYPLLQKKVLTKSKKVKKRRRKRKRVVKSQKNLTKKVVYLMQRLILTRQYLPQLFNQAKIQMKRRTTPPSSLLAIMLINQFSCQLSQCRNLCQSRSEATKTITCRI